MPQERLPKASEAGRWQFLWIIQVEITANVGIMGKLLYTELINRDEYTHNIPIIGHVPRAAVYQLPCQAQHLMPRIVWIYWTNS